MHLSNEIVLRPRFKKLLNKNNEDVLLTFEDAKKNQKSFIVTRIDDHVFIKFPKQKQHFWSPQLHLEIIQKESSESELFGLFGPNPTVWTLFMFFHFAVGTLFIGVGVWAYSNFSLNNPYFLQLVFMGLLVVIWVILYFIGKMGKSAGKQEMHELYDFMNRILQS